MKEVDMSAKAVTARLRLVSELRRLCLSLQKAKLQTEDGSGMQKEQRLESSPPEARKAK